MAGRLFFIQDDLMFSERLHATAARLGVTANAISPDAANTRTWEPADVVVLQATLRPERQLRLVDELLHREPQPIVVAVTGHLETELRRRLKRMGARLAAHSAMDRALARALEVSADDAGGADDARDQAPRRVPD
jgi:DNA-binding NarL/FixJ family response regulator